MYDSNAILEYTEQIETSSRVTINSITVDSNDRIIVAGYTRGPLHTENNNNNNGFFRVYSPDLTLKHAIQYEINFPHGIFSVTTDSNDRIIVAGSTSGKNTQGHSDALFRVYDYKITSPTISSDAEKLSKPPILEFTIPFVVIAITVVFALYTIFYRK